MEEIIKLLLTDTAAALKILREQQKDQATIAAYRKEYDDMDRSQRNTQLDQVQKGKTVNNVNKPDVKIPIDYAGQIIDTSVAFEFGEPVTLIPNIEKGKESKLADLFKKLWRANRIDNLIQKAVEIKKKETEAAFLFYISDIKPGSFIQKVLSLIGFGTQKKEIKISILESKNGSMSPYFDSFGGLLAFTWDFLTKDSQGKEVKNTWVYTEIDVYKIINDGIPAKEPHGFAKIPIVYTSQPKPEPYKAQPLIDRQEISLSKLCGSNDRTAHPILMTYGDLNSLPDSNDDGKVINFPMEWDEQAQKFVHGDAKFLTNDNAPQSAKLEMETIENLISYVTSTPIISLNQLKNIGNVAEKTVKLMFLAPILKAKKNEGDNRTMVERIINVMMSGIITTTNTNLKSEAEKLYFDVQFNSILPGDLKESADVVSVLAAAGLISKRTAVEYMDMNENVDEELGMIASETAAIKPVPANPEPQKV